MRYAGFLLFLSLVFSACRKDPETIEPVITPSQMVFSFSAVVAGQGKIVDDSVYYSNGLGDKFTVSLFKYYISNVSLIASDNAVFTEPESYHLIAHFGGKESFTISNVPKGDYTKVRFMIGVDSLKNVSGAQKGDLDVSNNMFWDWDTGYIFYKLEGNYIALSANKGEYAFHIGGFSGPHKTLEIVELSIPAATVGEGTVTRISILSDAGAIFNDPRPLSFDEYNQGAPSDQRNKVQSTNYRDMFSVDHIQVSNK